jgi:hypothetical protein
MTPRFLSLPLRSVPRSYSVLRFMDMQHTNNAKDVRWSDRKQVQVHAHARTHAHAHGMVVCWADRQQVPMGSAGMVVRGAAQ